MILLWSFKYSGQFVTFHTKCQCSISFAVMLQIQEILPKSPVKMVYISKGVSGMSLLLWSATQHKSYSGIPVVVTGHIQLILKVSLSREVLEKSAYGEIWYLHLLLIELILHTLQH